MVAPRSLLLGAACFIAGCLARSSTGDRVLVVLDSDIQKSDYTQFWSSLESRGYDLTFKAPKDETTELTKYGEAQYDHLILYAPTAKTFSKHLSPKAIIDAQLSGLNTLYLLSSSLSETSREVLREYDVEFSETGSLLLDAFSHPVSSPISSVLLPPTSCLVPSGPLLSNSTLSGGPVVYPSGAVHTLGQNPYLVEVAHAPSTAYVGEEKDLSADEAAVETAVGGKTSKGPIISGRKAALVSALQTRDNTRVGFVGSGAMFSDEHWGKMVKTAEGQTLETGNAAFADDFTRWVFQETGVIKIVSSTHHRDGETEPRDAYTKKDPVTYTITVAEYNASPKGGSWGPVSLPDLQLDFTMLDPHIRTALNEASSSSTGTTYTASFRAPDRHGVFKFVVEYWRPGWTYLRSATKASVVPLRHDEHPRWISGAWPFYSSAVSISAAFLLFCSLWVMLGEGDRKGKKKAE